MDNQAQISNMQKYFNYQEQMVRLKKALAAQFYLEAIFIEYAVMEDRLESILRHSGVFNPKRHNKIKSKLGRVDELRREKKSLLHRSFSDELIEGIYQWLDARNQLIHALMKQNLHTEDLQKIALEGQQIVKQLNSKATNYRKALERQAAKAQKQEG
jgi:hypothetical protein